MKVYSWKTLLVTIFGAGGGLVYAVCNVCQGATVPNVTGVVLFGVWLVQGLRAALTETGHAESVENWSREKRAYRRLFGKFAFVMPWGMLILFGIAAIFSRAIPERIWICLCFIIAAFVYEIWLVAVVDREIEREKAQQEE